MLQGTWESFVEGQRLPWTVKGNCATLLIAAQESVAGGRKTRTPAQTRDCRVVVTDGLVRMEGCHFIN